MNNEYGFIYARTHEAYDQYNAYKLGKASNIPERDSQYATGEIKRGSFEFVLQVQKKQMGIIENLLQNEFKNLNIKLNGGIEFYDKKIISFIESFLQTKNLYYKKLSNEEVNSLIRKYRVRKNLKKIKKSLLHHLHKVNKQIVKYIPRKYQEEIIQKACQYFLTNDKGILVLMCGVGKTLLSLWIAQQLNAKSILIGVPNLLLLEQWNKVVQNLFPTTKYLLVSSGKTVEDIREFIQQNPNHILITTYSSSYKVSEATKDFTYDIKINDEVHHLTSTNADEEERKTFVHMLKVNSRKQLSLSATLKILEGKETEDIISNDNKNYFGDIIDKKSLLWAIQEKILCDYVVQTIITNENKLDQQAIQFGITEENDKQLFLSAFSALKSINEGYSHHLLIYSNNQENSVKIIKYIGLLLESSYFNISNLYYDTYHSNMSNKDQITVLDKFKKEKNGIISCVYCLGEGWDCPLLDGVVFGENMSSNIRIVQSALRGSRKDSLQPNKLTKIIVPVLNSTDWLEKNNSSFEKIREIIYQIGLEDESITQKIKVFEINIEKDKKKKKEKENEEEFIDEYNDKLTQSLRLTTRRRTQLAITYEKAKKILSEKNIKSKEKYFELCKRDNRLSEDPELVFKGQFTNWIDYLSIERVYYDLETCERKINEYLEIHSYLKKHYLDLSFIMSELCKIDNLFPPNGLWVEYYNQKTLSDIFTISNKKKKSSTLLL